MAKKITLDFSKVEERTGWKTDHMPEGLHEFKIELVDNKDASDGTRMWTYGLRPTDPRFKTRLFPYYCKDQPNQMFKIRDLLVAAGIKVPKARFGFDPDAPIGKVVAGEVVDSSNPQFAGRSEINGVYGTDILDDVDTADDVEDDEEYEGEEEEVEEDEVDDEEAEEEGDDELREEIEGLTLAALRKRAKGLGIDTVGVKQADLIELVLEEELGEVEDDEEEELDDDDLDDEELEDEEFEEDEEDEEEEEEPEPAPARRRAAPAKTAAKAAPAAPAKRVIKRR